MTNLRAYDINNRLVAAYMVREGLTDKPLPVLADVTLTDAIEASRIMAGDAGSVRQPDGGTEFVCVVAPSRVPGLLAWAIGQLEVVS